MDSRPIGIFDSGVGGLSVWQAVRGELPHEALLFFADGGHAPYGSKSRTYLEERAARAVQMLLRLDAKLIVVACNTATVHTIAGLRESFPGVPFVGVVPVVKTLARETRTGSIGILGTPSTVASPYLAGLIEQFAADKRVTSVACEGLAELVDGGDVDGPRVRALLERYLEPVRGNGVDVVGLGCTHYPFLRPRIARLLGPAVRIYDPSEPVARRVHAALAEKGMLSGHRQPSYRFFTSGDADRFTAVARQLLQLPVDQARHIVP